MTGELRYWPFSPFMQEFPTLDAESNSSREFSLIINPRDYRHFQLDSDLKSPPTYVLRDGYLSYRQHLSLLVRKSPIVLLAMPMLKVHTEIHAVIDKLCPYNILHRSAVLYPLHHCRQHVVRTFKWHSLSRSPAALADDPASWA